MNKILEKITGNRYSIVFVVMILIPAILNIAGAGESGSTMEIRRKKVPEVSLKNFFKSLKNFEKYFEKNFPLRKELLSKRNFIYSEYLGVSPVDRVILGKEGWLFLRRLNNENSEIDYSISIDKFRGSELKYWFNIFKERYRFLQNRGIRLLILIVPNKSTVYREFLPESISRVTGGARAEQLTGYFKNNSDIQVINVKDLLVKTKSERQVYHKTDSHWNHYGAWLAYREIIHHFSKEYKGVKPVPYDDFPKRKIKTPSKADLASMLGLNRSLYTEHFERLFTPRGVKIRQTGLKDFKYKKIRTAVFKNENGALPKTLVIHDSFGRGLKKYMSASFSEIIFLLDWGFNFFPELIEREKPEIVIYEIAERFFYRPVPDLN